MLKRYNVYAIRTGKNGVVVWVPAGTAMSNRDGSFNVFLDVLPLDGKLHVREQSAGQPAVKEGE